MAKLIPTKKNLTNRFKDGLKGGLAGGLPSGILMALVGPFWGNLVGSTIGASLVDETTGRIIVVNGYMDAIQSLFI